MSNIIEGFAITIMGMAMVFAILLLLYFVLIIMKHIFTKAQNKPAEEPKKVQSSQGAAVLQEYEELDEKELIAVLTAAVAASLNQSTYNLHIKSYRRIDQNAPVWNRVSRREQLESRIR